MDNEEQKSDERSIEIKEFLKWLRIFNVDPIRDIEILLDKYWEIYKSLR